MSTARVFARLTHPLGARAHLVPCEYRLDAISDADRGKYQALDLVLPAAPGRANAPPQLRDELPLALGRGAPTAGGVGHRAMPGQRTAAPQTHRHPGMRAAIRPTSLAR